MARYRWLRPMLCAALLPLSLGGCVGVAVVGGLAAAGGAGYTAGQQRGINGVYDDVKLQDTIAIALLGANPPLGSISVSVYGGRVLLTGQAPSEAAKAQVERIADGYQGVRAVYNDIEVGPPETPWDVANDEWISARLRSELVLEPGVRSVNYTIDTANRSVYLIGSARNGGELDRATQIARYIPGVRRVVSYIEIAGGGPATADAAPPPPPPSQSAMPGPGNSAAEPSAPIQVQKL